MSSNRTSVERRASGRKHLMDDDNTFLPPALSSYSIALLNEKTIHKTFPQEVTGIYDLDFPSDRTRLRDKLVHFREAEATHSKSNATQSNQNSFNMSTNTFFTQNTSNHNLSLTSHNSSHNNSMHTTASANDQAEIYTRPDSGTEPRTVLHVKRLRGPRRFGKLLGPPQRASKIDTTKREQDEQQSSEPASANDLFSSEKELEIRRRIEEQKRINDLENRIIQSNGFSNTAVNDTFKGDSPFHNQENLDNFSSRPSSQLRRPLAEIPNTAVNQLDSSFRKPKLPKSQEDKHSPLKFPGQQRPLIPTAVPAPAPDSSAKTLKDSGEVKRKKTIGINGTQYEKLELLGRGGTSKVYKVKSLANNKLYAIKKVTFDQFDESCINGFKGEIDLLIRLKSSPRVVKLVDYAIGEGSIYLIMECGEIDLAHVLQSRLSQSLDLSFVKFHAIEMFKCVQAVHDAGIVHSDLKPANFLFVRGVLKIIDFGIANAVPDHTANIYRESQIGTPNYMAPEALIDINQSLAPMKDSNSNRNTWKVGKPSDVWSCGCIIYQMIYGKPPYGGYSGNQRIMAIMNPQVKIHFPSHGLGDVKVPQSAIILMQNCLTRVPHDRWTVQHCLESDFLNPKVVSETFIRDLVHAAVNFGYNNRVSGAGSISAEVYDKLVETVLKQIEELNYS